jgi:predicted esterase
MLCRASLVLVLAACGSQDVMAQPAPGSVGQYAFAGYPYLIFTPTAWKPDSRSPALLLIHGAGGNGAYMLNLWRSFAEDHDIVLVAPTFPLDTAFETAVPRLYPALMDTVRRILHFDSTRVYIFGYSAGAYSTYDAATLASTSFAAATVFAGIITPEYDWIIGKAQRKTPIAMYIGDHDQFFALPQTRRTRDVLTAAGFPVHYVELAHQDHNYAAATSFVNRDAWAYMSKYTLTSERR